MLESVRRQLARWIAPAPPKRVAQRMYASARNNRLTGGWYAPNNSADSELLTSITQLRGRSRALVRDAPYAKRARTIVVNNVVGSGIGMQAAVESTRGNRIPRINDDIESAWDTWCRAENCHTGGKLCFADIERQAMGQVFEAGEIFIRKHYSAFGSSRIPLALEIVEPERVADDYSAPPGVTVGMLRMGIEVDEYHRAIAVWIREFHPNEARQQFPKDRLQRVPADQIFHLHLVDRWPQTRGEPWLHAVARRLNDMDGYSEAEIVAARGAASYMGIIETPEPGMDIDPETGEPEDFDLEPGAVKYLSPGEKFTEFSPNRPNPNMDPFMRMMLREVAAGLNVSYAPLSSDHSQSNYSSSRLGLLDDRDTWRALQQWFIRAFRRPLHEEWMQLAVLAKAIPSVSATAYALDREKYNAVCFKPRGWSWVDPTKEVDAYKEAVRCGFTTVSAVIAATADGRDAEDMFAERKHELELMAAAGLVFDTDPVAVPDKASAPAASDPAAETTAEDTQQPTADQAAASDYAPARVVNLRATQ